MISLALCFKLSLRFSLSLWFRCAQDVLLVLLLSHVLHIFYNHHLIIISFFLLIVVAVINEDENTKLCSYVENKTKNGH